MPPAPPCLPLRRACCSSGSPRPCAPEQPATCRGHRQGLHSTAQHSTGRCWRLTQRAPLNGGGPTLRVVVPDSTGTNACQQAATHAYAPTRVGSKKRGMKQDRDLPPCTHSYPHTRTFTLAVTDDTGPGYHAPTRVRSSKPRMQQDREAHQGPHLQLCPAAVLPAGEPPLGRRRGCSATTGCACPVCFAAATQQQAVLSPQVQPQTSTSSRLPRTTRVRCGNLHPHSHTHTPPPPHTHCVASIA